MAVAISRTSLSSASSLQIFIVNFCMYNYDISAIDESFTSLNFTIIIVSNILDLPETFDKDGIMRSD